MTMLEDDIERQRQWRAEMYPYEGDPRRDPGWGTRTHESEIKALLGAILTELYKINERANVL